MEYIRLMKYPGSKKALLSDIQASYLKSGRRTFVDVFGGSGSVSLNIESRYTVYNDLNPDLINVFTNIQKRPENIYFLLKEGVKKRRSLLQEEGSWKKRTIDPEVADFIKIKGRERGIPEKDVESVIFLTGMNLTFGGMGNTYATKKEKAAMSYISKTLDQFDMIKNRVSRWKIENMDFRDLVKKYDDRNVFFYFDPPYSGTDWYEINFDAGDFRELSRLISGLEGKYLMTIDPDAEGIMEIFGIPVHIKEYRNENGPSDGIANPPPRKRAFYTNL